MSLTEIEREMTKAVVARFLNQKEPTARIPLLKKFKEPDALDRLVRCGILRTNDNLQFVPTALAFHYCEEDAVRNLARESVQVVLHVLQHLFETDEEEKEYTVAEIKAEARKMYDNIESYDIGLGLYLAQEFGVFGTLRTNPQQQAEILGLKIGEGIIRIRDIRKAWDDHIKQRSAYLERQRGPEYRQAFLRGLHDLVNGREDATISPMQFFEAGAQIGLDNDSVGQMIRYFLAENLIKRKPASEAIALTHEGVLEVEGLIGTVNSTHGRDNESPTKSTILVLISHSSRDAKLAEALVDLLRLGIGLLPEHIRCSSVDGYRLPAGAHTETQLRQEVNATRVLIGLITPSSLASPYVLFELGARWGGGNPMIPVLAGVKSDELRGPVSGLNALLCSEEAQLHQLLRDVGSQLNLPVQGADSYLKQVKAVKVLSDRMSSAEALHPPTQDEIVFEGSVYWKYKNGKREGPYCPVCYDKESKKIHLNPGATRGTYGCGACGNSFRTSEYNTPGPTGPSRKTGTSWP
jgi:TIR domain